MGILFRLKNLAKIIKVYDLSILGLCPFDISQVADLCVFLLEKTEQSEYLVSMSKRKEHEHVSRIEELTDELNKTQVSVLKIHKNDYIKSK